MIPEKFSAARLVGSSTEPRHVDLIPPTKDGWDQVAIMEWELQGQSWKDHHPHDEYNYIIEGTLYVEAGGKTVELNKGDAVRVPAGSPGRYWAPTYARMLAIYGSNPHGEESEVIHFEELTTL